MCASLGANMSPFHGAYATAATGEAGAGTVMGETATRGFEHQGAPFVVISSLARIGDAYG